MPGLLVVALAGSLLLHGVVLLGTDIALFGDEPEAPVLLQAELQPPPVAPPVMAAAKPSPRPPARAKATSAKTASAPPLQLPPEALANPEPEPAVESPAPASPLAAVPPPAEPVKPVLPASGVIRFAIFKESLAMQIGRAEHRWEFTDDGGYRLTAVSETSGLAALLRPARVQQESRGRLAAGGLQPESFRSLRDGKPPEGADFDWPAGVLRLLRNGTTQPLPPGAQDMLSLNYQLAYLGRLAEGAAIGVATARRFERHALDALGEEEIEVPAGRFRTLHLRALSDDVTEIWIALDQGCLPVKIRFTDKKGESFEQVATEIGH